MVPGEIVKMAGFMLSRSCSWQNPFGDGKAGERIIGILREQIG